MMNYLRATLILAALGCAAPVAAADFSDPTWPCIQRKVGALSVGLMWPQPIEPQEFSPEVEDAVEELVGRLTLRRLPVEEVQPAVDSFAEAQGTDPALIGHVFELAFNNLNSLRSRIIAGIEEYSLSQIDLSVRIDAARQEMNAEMAKDDPDFDRVDELEEQIAWDERIYTDRRQSLTYVCETPVLLEKRLYAISQMLQAKL